MVLDNGGSQNIVGNIWANNFIENLDQRMWYKVKTYPSDNKFKFGVEQILKSLYVIEISILLAGEQITIKFDVSDSDITLLLGKNTIKQWNLTINTGNYTVV